MAHLPTVGGDEGTWGQILNDFLAVEHDSDGTLLLGPTIDEKYLKPMGGIPSSHFDAAVQAKLTAIGTVTPAAGSISNSAVAPDAAIQQSKIADLVDDLAEKVATTDARMSDTRLTIKNDTTTIGTRRKLNFSQGASMPVAATLDSGNDRISVQFSAAPGAGASDAVWLNVKDYGATGDGTTDDTAAFQELIAEIEASGSGAVLYVPVGTYLLSEQLVIETGIRLLGDGPGASVLQWEDDLGSSSVAAYGISLQTSTTPSQLGTTIEGFTLLGPAGAKQVGVRQVWMHAIRSGRANSIRNLEVKQFNAGLYIFSDHERIENVTCTANYYGVYFGAGNAGSGQSFFHCNFSNNALASVACHPTSTPHSILFVSTAFGISPYAFYREEPNVGGYSTFLSSVCFSQCDFSTCGNGIFYAADNSGDGVSLERLVFTATRIDDAFALGQQIDEEPAEAMVSCGTIAQWQLTATNPFAVPGSIAIFQAKVFYQNAVWEADTSVDAAITAGKQWLDTLSATGNELRYKGALCRTIRTTSSLAVGDLVEASGNSECAKYTSGIPVGVAVMPASNGEITLIAYNQEVSVRVATPGSIPATPRYLKPDATNAGCVVAASGPTDGAIIGISTAADASGKVICRLARIG
jgi:hypothetical protein